MKQAEFVYRDGRLWISIPVKNTESRKRPKKSGFPDFQSVDFAGLRQFPIPVRKKDDSEFGVGEHLGIIRGITHGVKQEIPLIQLSAGLWNGGVTIAGLKFQAVFVNDDFFHYFIDQFAVDMVRKRSGSFFHES